MFCNLIRAPETLDDTQHNNSNNKSSRKRERFMSFVCMWKFHTFRLIYSYWCLCIVCIFFCRTHIENHPFVSFAADATTAPKHAIRRKKRGVTGERRRRKNGNFLSTFIVGWITIHTNKYPGGMEGNRNRMRVSSSGIVQELSNNTQKRFVIFTNDEHTHE